MEDIDKEVKYEMISFIKKKKKVVEESKECGWCEKSWWWAMTMSE